MQLDIGFVPKAATLLVSASLPLNFAQRLFFRCVAATERHTRTPAMRNNTESWISHKERVHRVAQARAAASTKHVVTTAVYRVVQARATVMQLDIGFVQKAATPLVCASLPLSFAQTLLPLCVAAMAKRTRTHAKHNKTEFSTSRKERVHRLARVRAAASTKRVVIADVRRVVQARVIV
jgi:ribosomal protein S30